MTAHAASPRAALRAALLVAAVALALAALLGAAPARAAPAALARRSPSFRNERPALTATPVGADGADGAGGAAPEPTAAGAAVTRTVRSTTTSVRGGTTYVIPTTRATATRPAATPAPTGGAGASAAIPAGGPTGHACDVSDAMVVAVNAARLLNGVYAPLKVNPQLAAACVRHALDMARNSVMSHTGSDGSNPATRAADAGYNWSYISENVAAGQTSLVQVMESWMNSSGHRANILSQSVRDMAAAAAANAAGKYFWVQCFGAL